MKRFLVVTSIILCVFFLSRQANAQSNQTVINGNQTTAINFPTGGCTYNWVNNTPGIGLAASGTGDISAFTTVNNGTTPITATVTVNPVSAGFAYIANSYSNTVSVINVATGAVVATVNVGNYPTAVSVSQDGTKAYILNSGSRTVSVINTATNTVTATFPTGSAATSMSVSPDGSNLYVASVPPGSIGIISVINTTSGATIGTITVGNGPDDVFVSPDGSKVYVIDPGDATVSIINASSNSVMYTLQLPQVLSGGTISPDGTRLYIVNDYRNNVSVINTANNSIIATIPVGSQASGATITPDGKWLYVTNFRSNTVSVINTSTNTVVSTIPVGSYPDGVSVNPDGSKVYVSNSSSSSVSVINVATNTVASTIPVGIGPNSWGNFISSGPVCNSSPITFTITVNPTSVAPVITAGAVTGTISACEGSPSESPNVAQFAVSGNSLTNDIVATAPAGFEVSLFEGNGYSNTVTIPQSGGAINNVTIYVRSSASATGNIVGNVTLTSTGATDKTVTVTGKVNTLPTVSNIPNQKIVDGTTTKGIVFSGTGADTYNWVNDNPSIGISYGTSSEIVQFTATNKSQVPVIGTFTVTPINTTTGCNGAPVTFTIEVDPRLPAVITAAGTLSPISTIYGTASTSTSFSVSGTNMNAGILVIPPAGFEVSADNINFSPTVTVGKSGTINATTVYVRLTSQTPVGRYSGNIVLSSSGTADSIVPIPVSLVHPAVLTITANNVEKVYGQTLTNGTLSAGFTSNGLQNNETIGNVFITYNSGAGPSDKAGTYTGSVVPSNAAGGSFNPNNYTITYQSGDIIVIEGAPNQPIAIPNAFTPNGDGINDVWNIKSLIYYPSCLVSIFTRYGSMIYQSKGYSKPWDGVYNSNPLPAGTYYYIINLQNGQPPFSGWVALIR